MTTEVVVMNKLAVALAADSAVTVGYEDKNKIYNSANKVFALGHHCPVGIMIYGSADLMEIPWETILKIYRKVLGRGVFPHLQDYALHFMRFLEENSSSLFPEEHQVHYFFIHISSYFTLIYSDIMQQKTQIEIKKGVDAQKQYKDIISSVLDNHHERLNGREDIPTISADQAEEILIQYEKVINDAIVNVFGEQLEEMRNLIENLEEKLKEIAGYLVRKNLFSNLSTGVVFAGFGEKDIFPSFTAYKVESVIYNRLKYAKDTDSQITFDNLGVVKSFAQSDMVEMFMQGIHPDYREILRGYIAEFLSSYTKTVLNDILSAIDVDSQEQQELISKVSQANEEIVNNVIQEINDFQSLRHARPIMLGVSYLPLDELASMAEALVSLTSFKRRVSTEEETVGGPIDVAVITKKDGFIWIKRKHYFSPELNHHYFNNYD